MADTATLVFAALALFITFMAWLIHAVTGRLGELRAGLRAADARLVAQTPTLAQRMAARREGLAAISTHTERALWSLSRFDERADAAQTALSNARTTLDNDRARLIAARGAIIRVQKSARMILKMLELRRTILG